MKSKDHARAGLAKQYNNTPLSADESAVVPLTKCDLLAQPGDSAADWMERIEQHKRDVDVRFRNFLAHRERDVPYPGFVRDVELRLAHEHRRESEAKSGEGDSQEEGFRA